MAPGPPGAIYGAVYSNTPVYEFNCEGNHVMRRRADNWINATHILKVADFDKPARTRILEREVQKRIHEKVQGGYGKYQGTWVPLEEGRALAERNGVLDKLLPIFDFVPGDQSPPPAPKHATAVSARPKAPRQSAAVRRMAAASQMSEDPYDDASAHFDETPDAASIVTDSILDEQEVFPNSQMSGSRKRKREQISLEDQYHQIWSDQLLDYFMLLHSEDRLLAPPEPHPGVNVDRPIDDKGHSAMHWAAAMGDLDTVRDLINRGAHIDSLSESQETPLMRAVLFTNNLDKRTMPEMVNTLAPTILRKDWFGSTVVHHIAATTSSKNKYESARYYLGCITDKLLELWGPEQTSRFLNEQDRNGDTAIMIAARNGARRSVRHLIKCNASTNVVNSSGENAAEMIQSLNKRLRERHLADRSSSPVLPDGMTEGGLPPTSNPTALSIGNGVGNSLLQPPAPHYTSQTAATLMNKVAPQIVDKFVSLAQAYETEFHDRESELNESLGVHRKRQAELEAQRAQLVDIMDSATSNGDHDVAAAAAAVLRASRGEATPEEAERMWVDATATIQRRDEEENTTLMTHEGEAEREVNLLSRLELEVSIADSEEKRGIQGDDERYEQLGNLDSANQDEIMQLTQQLDAMEADRMMLVKEIVQDMSYAGVSEKQAEYKKLISLSIPGISEDQVDEVLPEIVADLEEEKRRRMLDEAD